MGCKLEDNTLESSSSKFIKIKKQKEKDLVQEEFLREKISFQVLEDIYRYTRSLTWSSVHNLNCTVVTNRGFQVKLDGSSLLTLKRCNEDYKYVRSFVDIPLVCEIMSKIYPLCKDLPRKLRKYLYSVCFFEFHSY